MKTYECENCGSLFIVNERDLRVESGDYTFENGCTCPLCSCDMLPGGSDKSSKDA